ncbi:MAG: aminotransferase class I/II-fold pyridoxal phosphate-dependent enzyme [Myxococcaceae bacterium]|nr:aminotransferase class I/II-fold pyridoxal phosphate-dependent enzyme [Myxococcaceae bacterium]
MSARRGVEAQRVASFGTTVFTEFSKLAVECQAVNLGQGFPDFDGPAELKQAAAEAMAQGKNQYAPMLGVPELRHAVAAHAQRFYEQTVNPDTEVVVTSGATEALLDAILGLVDPGDEVVLFEPWYDSYFAGIQLAQAVPRMVRLRPPDLGHAAWWFDEGELKAAFSNKTRLVLLNTPHNPTGKVFLREELELIGQLASKYGATVVSDEVYEHLVFAPARHVRTATVPNLADRTLTISSAGKTFSYTGWKVGWALGPAPLVRAVAKVHQWATFATATPFQHAVAKALMLPDTFFRDVVREYHQRRDLLARALTEARLPPYVTEGSYFLMVDTRAYAFDDDVAFCRWLTRDVRVAAIPPSAFYAEAHKGHAAKLARFAFCKSGPVLEEAARRLGRAKENRIKSGEHPAVNA